MITSGTLITFSLVTSALIAGGTAAVCILRRRKSDKSEEQNVRDAVDDILRQAASPMEPTAKNLRGTPTDSDSEGTFDKDKGATAAIPRVAPDKPEPATCHEIPISSPKEEEKTLSIAPLQPIAESVEDEDLRLLLLDRLDEMDEETDVIRQALCAVDVFDEITQMRNAYAGTDVERLEQFLATIKRLLSEQQRDILCSDVWEPATQKITRTDYNLPEGAAPAISANLSSGLRVNGRLIRKQSIALSRSLSEH